MGHWVAACGEFLTFDSPVLTACNRPLRRFRQASSSLYWCALVQSTVEDAYKLVRFYAVRTPGIKRPWFVFRLLAEGTSHSVEVTTTFVEPQVNRVS